jgi:hypothetical protein
MSRRADGPKFIDFSVGMPAPIHGGPPPCRRPAGGSRLGSVPAGRVPPVVGAVRWLICPPVLSR